MVYDVIAGYIVGFKVTLYDDAHDLESEHYFANIINDLVEQGAEVLWDTYRVFNIDEMAFASVVIDYDMENCDYPCFDVTTKDNKRIEDIKAMLKSEKEAKNRVKNKVLEQS